MEITIKTKKDNNAKSNKTRTILSASIVVIILVGVIGYCVYFWKNKPETVFYPVKNKRIANLLKESKEINVDIIQEKGKLEPAKRILKKLKKECKDEKLINDKGEITSKCKDSKLSETIKKALDQGEEAEAEIKTFMDLKSKSKNDSLKQEEFNELVHGIIETSLDKQKTPPTDKQVEKAFGKLEKTLKAAQTAWDDGKEGDTSYEKLYVHHSLVSEYKRIKGILDNNKPDS